MVELVMGKREKCYFPGIERYEISDRRGLNEDNLYKGVDLEKGNPKKGMQLL